jgi:hypothetical protein
MAVTVQCCVGFGICREITRRKIIMKREIIAFIILWVGISIALFIWNIDIKNIPFFQFIIGGGIIGVFKELSDLYNDYHK